MTWQRGLTGAAAALLLVATVLVFVSLDRGSHSVSDTVRPFVITMGPVWLLAGLVAVVLRRRSDRPR